MDHLRQLARILRTDGAVGAIASMLGVTVVALLAMHPFALWLWGETGVWDLFLEAGMISMFGWGMWGWGVVLATALALRTRAWSLLAWSLVLFVLMADDMLEIHELVARRLNATSLSALPGPPELLALGALGVICLSIALIARALATGPVRGVHTALIVILAVGAFFGVGADTVQNFTVRDTPVWLLVTLVEQVGEALTTVAVPVALIAWIGHGIDPTRPATTTRRRGLHDDEIVSGSGHGLAVRQS